MPYLAVEDGRFYARFEAQASMRWVDAESYYSEAKRYRMGEFASGRILMRKSRKGGAFAPVASAQPEGRA